MLIVARDTNVIQNLKTLLNGEFDMNDLGAAKKILGMEIYRDRTQKKVFLSQKEYIQKNLASFWNEQCKTLKHSFVNQREIISYFSNSISN
uniref:Retrovirus-related Pol polyprotein from transposon TNT 1-94 n=1 Tax=Cajanus cajan TaxID=3821 RepID=A0A151SYT8_CAJCA|nr:Retrovirus-related Pol polyprotein from transposon TNT 1-94 [Cajanus cajan]